MRNPYAGGQAFPSAESVGMSYRMWLAGLAMQGMLAGLYTHEQLEERAVEHADKMIAALGFEPFARESS